MNRLSMTLSVMLAVVLVAALAPVVAAGQGPIGLWKLKGDFSNAKGAPPSMVSVGDSRFAAIDVNGTTRQALVFDSTDLSPAAPVPPPITGEGMRIRNIPKSARLTYSVDIHFKLDDVDVSDRYQRIMSFGPSKVDRGVYAYGDGVNLYPHRDPDSPKAVLESGEWVRLRVTRNARTKMVKVFVDGKRLYSYKDRKNLYKLRDGVVVLFVDDSDENGTGAAARVKLWDRVVTP